MKMSIAIAHKINEKFLKSLKSSKDKLASPITIDEWSEACKKAFPLWANPLKEYLLEQDRLDAKESQN